MANCRHNQGPQSISRRTILKAAAATAVAPATALAGSPTDLIPAVDTHQHLWDLNKLTLPWLSSAPEILKHNYGLPEYAQATAGLNVCRRSTWKSTSAPKITSSKPKHSFKSVAPAQPPRSLP